jgi:tRNA (cytidine/uridine-2'-O-)-methyltransferase
MDIALYRPEIPQNTGNIGRICVCTNSPLHIIGKPSFSLEEAAVRRAGLDYWPRLKLKLHEEWQPFLSWFQQELADGKKRKLLLVTKFGSTFHSNYSFQTDDIILFGRETSGVPEEVHQWFAKHHPEGLLRIPVAGDCRSLNLGNAVSIVLFEGLRQLNYPGLSAQHPEGLG